MKWKLEIEMKLLEKNGIRIKIEFFFQNGNNAGLTMLRRADTVRLYRFACEEPVGLRLVPLLSYPEGLPPCPVSAEVDDPVTDNLIFRGVSVFELICTSCNLSQLSVLLN